MAKTERQFEEEQERYPAKKRKSKSRSFERTSTDEKFAGVEHMFKGEKDKGRPVSARVLHMVERVPKNRKDPKNPPAPGEGEQKPEPSKSPEERLAEIEKRIETEFSETEKRFIEPWNDDYLKEFWAAKAKVEEKGGSMNAEAFRKSFIIQRTKWGLERQIAPEKAELLEKYLELKLPMGIPEGKKESIFTPEQQETIEKVAGNLRKFYLDLLEESKRWQGFEGADEDRVKRVEIDTRAAVRSVCEELLGILQIAEEKKSESRQYMQEEMQKVIFNKEGVK